MPKVITVPTGSILCNKMVDEIKGNLSGLYGSTMRIKHLCEYLGIERKTASKILVNAPYYRVGNRKVYETIDVARAIVRLKVGGT